MPRVLSLRIHYENWTIIERSKQQLLHLKLDTTIN